MNRKKIFKAKKNYPRLDHFLNDSLAGMSRSQIEKLIKANRVKLNDKIVTRKNTEILPADRVEVEFIEPVKREYFPSMELKKLFEDEYLLIVDKPIGISVHPGAGEKEETVVRANRR